MAASSITHKVCTKCGKDKALREFYNNVHGPCAKHWWCKKCMNTDHAKRAALPVNRVTKRRKDNAKRSSTPKYKEYMRRHHLMKLYGLTLEDYDAMYESQQGLCSICNRHRDKLLVDHDHQTGVVRGLLCAFCNSCLSHFGDSLEGVMRVVAYLSST
jgi:hypothetical protein